MIIYIEAITYVPAIYNGFNFHETGNSIAMWRAESIADTANLVYCSSSRFVK